jgi:hypothetical protein
MFICTGRKKGVLSMTNINEHLEQRQRVVRSHFLWSAWQSLQIRLSSLEYFVSLNCSQSAAVASAIYKHP